MKWLSVQICSFCWFQSRPHVKPGRVVGSPLERCYDCGNWTKGGIYVRRQEKPVEFIDE